MKAHNLRATQAAQLAEILLDMDADDPRLEQWRNKGSNGGDFEKLRGLPAIGRGVNGCIPGTSPHGALIAKENRRRR